MGWFHERTAFSTAVYKSIIFNCNVRYQTDTRLLIQKSIATIQKLGFTRDSVTMLIYDRVVETKIMLWSNKRTKRLGLDQVSLAHQRHFIYCHNTDCILPYRKWQSRILIWFLSDQYFFLSRKPTTINDNVWNLEDSSFE